MKEDIAKLIEEVLGIKPIVVNSENSKIASILKEEMRKVATLRMINDAESTAKNITSGNIKDLTTVVCNVGIMLANTMILDDEDARIVGVDNVIRLVNDLEKSRVHFNQIAIGQRNRLHSIIADLKAERENNAGADNDIDDDLTKLTKEELIARLSEKSK